MNDAQLQILIKARNEAKAQFESLNKQVNTLKGNTSGASSKLKEFGGKFQEITGVSLGFATAAGAAGMAVKGVVDYLKSAIDETVAYATAVDSMSRMIGISTEETSRLIQASDDLFISQESLQTALVAASRKGIDVSIEGLKRLSEQYLAMEEGGARAKFLAENFGRSGMEMGKLMEVGADGIDEATGAIADNLVVTQKSMREAILYKQSVDNLNDAWGGFKQEVGREVIPVLTNLLNLIIDLGDANKTTSRSVADFLNELFKGTGLESDYAREQRLLLERGEALNELYGISKYSLSEYSSEMDNAAEVQKILNNRLGELKTIMGGEFGNEIDDYAGKVSEVKDRTKELKDKIRELEEKSYLTPEQKADLEEMQGELGTTAQKLIELKDQHELTMKTMAMNMLITKASSDGLTENEITNISNIMVAWGLWDEETARVVENINGINLDDANLEISTLKENILGIEDKVVTIKVRVDYGYEGAGWNIGKMETDSGIDLNGNGIIGAAQGANFTVPPGFPNDSLLIGVSSGEHVNVTPAPNKGSGNTTIVFNYSPALSLADKVEVETRIKPMLLRLMQEV